MAPTSLGPAPVCLLAVLSALLAGGTQFLFLAGRGRLVTGRRFIALAVVAGSLIRLRTPLFRLATALVLLRLLMRLRPGLRRLATRIGLPRLASLRLLQLPSGFRLLLRLPALLLRLSP